MTAVEWLVEKMIERKFFAKDLPLSYTTLEHLINQAKEMERQQIEETWYDCKISIICKEPTTADQYYNKKYKK